MIAACLLLLVFFSVALGNTWWEVATCGELGMVISHSPTIWHFLGTAAGLLLATAVPVLLVLRAFVWNRIGRLYWIFIFLLLIPPAWSQMWTFGHNSLAWAFVSGACSLVLVPLLFLPDRSSSSEYPAFDHWREFLAPFLTLLGAQYEHESHVHWQEFMAAVLFLIGLLLITPTPHHHGAAINRNTEFGELMNGIYDIQLAVEEVHASKGIFPDPSQVKGGTVNDVLSKVSSFPGYPDNSISHQNFYCGPFWYQRETPDFLDLELLPSAKLKRWKKLSNYGGEGSQKSVNVAPIYYEVLERFERKKQEGEIPGDMVHPFSGHFLYLVNRDRTEAALVPFRPGYSESNDYMSPRFHMESDGDPDGIEAVYMFPTFAPTSKNWDRQLYYDPPGPKEAEDSQDSSGAEGG